MTEHSQSHKSMIYCAVSKVKMNLNWFSSSAVHLLIENKRKRESEAKKKALKEKLNIVES